MGSIVSATLEIYRAALRVLLPTPSKAHYVFSLRDFARVIHGCCLIHKDAVENRKTFLRYGYILKQQLLCIFNLYRLYKSFTPDYGFMKCCESSVTGLSTRMIPTGCTTCCVNASAATFVKISTLCSNISVVLMAKYVTLCYLT